MEDTQEVPKANRFSFLGFETPKTKNEHQEIGALLKKSKIIAIVGLSDKRTRDSFMVAEYLLGAGYTIIPVNPTIRQWEGIESYPSLTAVPPDIQIDIIDIFRTPDAVPGIIDEALSLMNKPKAIWIQGTSSPSSPKASLLKMQLGIEHKEAAQKAETAGIAVIQNKCLKIEHQKLGI